MPVIATVKAIENDTIVVGVAFTDEDGAEVTPNTIKWSWVKMTGEVINNRLDEVVSPASSVDIALTGDDLELPEGVETPRRFRIYGTYNSDAGSNLNYNRELQIPVQNTIEASS